MSYCCHTKKLFVFLYALLLASPLYAMDDLASLGLGIPQQVSNTKRSQTVASRPQLLKIGSQRQINNPQKHHKKLGLSLNSVQSEMVLSSEKSSSLQKMNVIARNHTSPLLTEQELQSNSPVAGAQQVTFANKKNLPGGAQLFMKTSHTSFTQGKSQHNFLHPSHSISSSSTATQKYQQLIQSFEKNETFLPLFTKLHLVALHQVYEYLMSIYASLSITHINDIESYITVEKEYALNTKTVIVSHLINLIEAQLNQALRALLPGLPQEQATHVGMACINGDEATRIDLMLVDMEQVLFHMFDNATLSAQEWQSVLKELTNEKNKTLLQKISATSVQSLVVLLQSYLTTSMDLQRTSNYIEKARQTFQKTKLKKLFKGAIPSAQTLYTTVEQLAQQEQTELPPTVSFLQQLTHQERTVLIDSLDLLTHDASNKQKTNDAQALIQFLKNNTNESLTTGQLLLVKHLVTFVTIKKPLQHFITQLQILYSWLFVEQKSLTQQQKTLLHSAISFALLQQEQTSAQGLEKTIAQTITLLEGKKEQLSKKELILFQTIQTTNFNTIKTFDTFTKQIEQWFDITTFEAVSSSVNTQDATFLQKCTASELLMLFAAFKGALGITNNRIARHTTQSTLLNKLFQNESEYVLQLSNALRSTDYTPLLEADQTLYDVLFKTEQDFTAFDTLSPQARQAIQTLLQTLVSLPSHAISPTTVSDANPAYPQVERLQQQGLFNAFLNTLTYDPLVEAVTHSLTKEQEAILFVLAKKISEDSLSLQAINADEKKLLLSLLENYFELLKKNETTIFNKPLVSKKEISALEGARHPLQQKDHQALEHVATIAHSYTHLSSLQNSWLASLGAYLSFAHAYTMPLHTQQGSLSLFYQTAQQLAQELSHYNISLLNPPLFFYNAATFESLKLTPYLAHLVEKTKNVPLPTFGIDTALSLNPLGQAENNQVKLAGKSVTVPSLTLTWQGTTYSPRFFFKDATGKPFANSASLQFPQQTQTSPVKNNKIRWLEKQSIPSSNHTNSKPYIYVPAHDTSGRTIEPQQEEGFFANIPLVIPDPAKKGSSLIRLYEQQLRPQPDWLNSKKGILTMIQVCMGDFAAGFAIDNTLFDPILQCIFKKALHYAHDNSFDFIDLTEKNIMHLEKLSELHLLRNYLDASEHQKAMTTLYSQGQPL